MKRALGMLSAVIKKELRQTVRDRRMMALLLAAPVIQLTVFGYAVNFDIDHVPTVVVDHDDSHASRTHLRRLLADGTLEQVARTPSEPDAERMLETGEAAIVLVVPHGFEHDLTRGRTATVQAILDGTNPNRANVAGAAIATYFAQEADVISSGCGCSRLASLGMAAPTLPDLSIRSRVLFNPELKTAIYMVPGVLAILLMLITTIISAMGLSRERERGTLEQIMVTPVPSGLLILGKIVPFAGFGLVDFGFALTVGAYLFDLPLLRADFALLFLATGLYLLTTLGVGLLISTFSSSQQQAFMGGFLFMLPASLLSGIMTPVQSMPDWLRPFTMINPLRHYAEVLRGSLLRGAGFAELSTQLTVLGVMGVTVFTFASLRFRRSIG